MAGGVAVALGALFFGAIDSRAGGNRELGSIRFAQCFAKPEGIKRCPFGQCLSQYRQWQGRCGKAYGFRYPMSASVTPDGCAVLVGSARGALANFKRGRRRDRRESAT